jgi:hypothetical protein
MGEVSPEIKPVDGEQIVYPRRCFATVRSRSTRNRPLLMREAVGGADDHIEIGLSASRR